MCAQLCPNCDTLVIFDAHSEGDRRACPNCRVQIVLHDCPPNWPEIDRQAHVTPLREWPPSFAPVVDAVTVVGQVFNLPDSGKLETCPTDISS